MSEAVQNEALQGKAAAKMAKKEARKQAKLQKNAGKVKIRKWRGLLADANGRTRAAAFVVLAISMVSLSFTQLGFLGIGASEDYVAYCVTLLAPMALASLLFGMPLGSLAGFVAGCVLFAHSQLQPLDYYEMDFITVASSIVLFSFIGVLMSFLFAVALRKNPPLWRRFLYIFIVCIVVSSLFSNLFSITVIAQLLFFYANLAVELQVDMPFEEVATQIIGTLSQLGDHSIQVWMDAALMLLACYAGYGIVMYERATREDRSLRTTFRSWLVVVLSFVFMITAGASFVVITEQAKAQAKDDIESEIDYLKSQTRAYENRISALNHFLEKDAQSIQGIDESEIADLQAIFALDKRLLDGYDETTSGTIIILKDNKILLSNSDAYQPGITKDSLFLSGLITIRSDDSREMTGELQQVSVDAGAQLLLNIVDDSELDDDEIQALLERRISTHVAYMLEGQEGNYTIMFIRPATAVFSGRTAVMAWTSLSALVLLMAVYFLISRLLSLIVVRRIDETNDVLTSITNGDLDAQVDIRDSREFKSLSTGINSTVGALKTWIGEAESRMDQELATAKAIQESALPRVFPPFPDIHLFDIYASMHPAKKVGGDFYDFFLIGDDTTPTAGKIGFVVADVSGKGVPAALFMMAAKTEVRNYLESGIDPGEAVENANRQLCDGNDAGMFVTLFAGVLDYASGHVQYVNAGHNPPLLWQAGSWRWLKDVSGMPLGLFDGFPYDTYELDLSIGDEFFIYTDGVTEAMNKEGELYSEERLEELLNANFTLHPRQLIETVRQELVRYAHGAVQSDDITMLALEYGIPPELTATLTVKADIAELPRVTEFIHTELDRRLCPVKVQKQLDIALEELFVNVARYAYPDAPPESPGRVRVSYTYSADPPSVCVEIADKGVPYNPLEKPDAVTPDDIMDVPIGGLGILMAKKSVDEMDYEYVDGYNIVSFKKKW